MAKPTIPLTAPAVALLVATMLSLVDGTHIGVCLGLNANNLPPAPQVINLYKSSGIEMLRLYNPHHEVLDAIRGSGLTIALATLNQELPAYASDPNKAVSWVNDNIVPYKNDINFKWITMGNEVVPSEYASSIAGAMRNMRSALSSAGITGVQVTTVISSGALSASYPPSAGTFAVPDIMSDICSVLAQDGTPLMLNVYPYFAYSSDPGHISSDYALFKSSGAVVVDGEYSYNNLFDAMVDAVNVALEKINYGSVKLAISETGWPTAGNTYATVANAETYNKNLLNHVMANGTPRRPSVLMETFFFEMFNENLKESGVEQNFGFFNPNMQPVYPFW